MTPDTLTQARAEEAARRLNGSPGEYLKRTLNCTREEAGALAMAEVIAEGWTPPEPVDPDLLEARQLATQHSWGDRDFNAGNADDTPVVKIALAALRRGRELAFANRPSDKELAKIARKVWLAASEPNVMDDWVRSVRALLTALGIGAKP